MGTLARTLEIARAELGYTESPANSNKTKYGLWFGVNGQPWCAIFVCWVMSQAGVPYSKQAYTPSLAQWYKSQGRWSTTPHAGDVVFFDFPGGHDRIEHTGIVESVGNGYIVTIEGNTSLGNNTNGGAVMRRQRSGPSIAGYGRPQYSDITMPPTNGPAPLIEYEYPEDQVKTAFLEIQLDSNGNGWTAWNPGFGRDPVPMGALVHGPYAPVDGYWAQTKAFPSAQARGNEVIVDVMGGVPNTKINVFASAA
jgi:hypothetical protein